MCWLALFTFYVVPSNGKHNCVLVNASMTILRFTVLSPLILLPDVTEQPQLPSTAFA